MAHREMSNLDYFFLAEELKVTEGSRLTGVYETSPRVFRFKFSKERQEFNLVAELGQRMHLTKYIEPSPPKPTQFASILRTHLEGLRLKTVEQLNFDRILQLSFEGRGNPSLVMEMFRKGNLVLCEGSKITAVYEKRAYAARTLKPGEAYVAPPAAEIQPSELEPRDFSALKGPVVAALAKAVNLAPFYVEEACSRTGVEYKKEAAELTESEKTVLAKEIKGLFDAGRKEPALYYSEGRVEDYAPIAMKKFAGMQSKKLATFNEALDEYYREVKASAALERAELEIQGKRLQLERTIAAQRSALAELERKALEAKESGEAFYANYDLINEVLEAANEFKKKRLSDEEATAELNKCFSGRAKVTLRGRTIKIELKSKRSG